LISEWVGRSHSLDFACWWQFDPVSEQFNND
jgi:hypothetical protein